MFVVFNCHYFFVTFSIDKLPLLEKFPKRQVTEVVDFFEICREDSLTNNPCQRYCSIVGVCQAPVVSLIRVADMAI